MNLHGLRLFHYVAKTSSFTKAADILHISQPAVSSQIKKFEGELDIPLFHKNSRKWTLTPFGEELAERAELFFAHEKQLEQFVQDYQLAKKGRLRITATYLPANFLIPQWTAAFKAENEEVEISITTRNSQDAFHDLIHFKADMAMYAGGLEGQREEVEWRHLFQDEIWFVVSPQHRLANCSVSLEDVIKEPFIMREAGSSTRERLISLCQTYRVSPPKIALQFNGLNEAIRSVMTGYGVNFVSSLVVKNYVDTGQLARVFVDIAPVKNIIAICTRKGEKPSPIVERFIRLCMENSKNNQ
ncbi:LysR family transcriptional regulator [Alkalihalobacillus trypoxylicola]|uniref:Transcriptional regulator n=1 Tax=Alkalihalobacillus trypoxylicola TaxID=519424 RepID=A0A162E763_9BACI|nr:LysR family transcriptional regulator [Alkalihalobacillus trypoxylicola]KYG31939.1 transcriptional regulator [Alkalihalobacillus trypoxylicola]